MWKWATSSRHTEVRAGRPGTIACRVARHCATPSRPMKNEDYEDAPSLAFSFGNLGISVGLTVRLRFEPGCISGWIATLYPPELGFSVPEHEKYFLHSTCGVVFVR